MSHPAIVAYEKGNGRFDLHYSRNGAEQYQLKEILEGYLGGEYRKTGSDMPPLLPTEVAEFAANQEGIEVRKYKLIEESPFAEGVEPAQIPHLIPDISAEALFIIQDWTVEVYSIIPTTPSLLPFLARVTEVQLYNCEQLGISPQQATSDEQPASHSLSGLDFFDLSIYEEMSNVLYYSFSQYHLDLLNRTNKSVLNKEVSDSEDLSTVLYHDGCVIEYSRLQSEGVVPWSAIFINTWSKNDKEPTYSWEHDRDSPSPRWLTNELRLELSMIFIKELRQGIKTLRADGRSGLVNIRECRRRELMRFSTEIRRRYGAEISEKFSDFTPFFSSIRTDI